MLKNLSFTFQKYSDQSWGRVGAFENNYVPDEIFAPVMAAIYSRAGDILKYTGVIDRAAHAASLRQHWSWPAVVGHTMRLWHKLDPVCGDVFRKAEDDAAIRVIDPAPGKGGGMCFSDYIDFQRDFSLNDPMYLAHESGHLMAAMNGPDLDDNMLPWNMTEMPAFFMQERAYDDLRAHARDAEELRAVTVLTVFGVHNKADLKHAAEKSCAHIADEIARCGFKPDGGFLSPHP